MTQVASYGRQLGWLTEIIIALAHQKPPPPETLRRLEDAAAKIEALKKQVRPSPLEAADAALDRLEHDDPAAYEALLRRRRG